MKVERKCKIVSKEQMGDAVYMVLEAGDMVRTSFRAPGQFVHVKCGEGLLLRRPISVCTCYSDEPSDLLTIVFEVRGEGTDWLARRPVGHSLDVLGLAGNGFTMKPEGHYLLGQLRKIRYGCVIRRFLPTEKPSHSVTKETSFW